MALTPRQQRLAFLGAYAGYLFDFFEIALIAIIIVPVAKTFGLSVSSSALVISLQLLTIPIGGLLFGWLGDRLGRKEVMMWTIAIYGLGTFARAFTFSYWWLILFTFVAALGIGGEYGLGQTLVSEVVRPRFRGTAAGLLYGASYFGTMIAASFGIWVIPTYGWRFAFGLASLPILVVLLVRFTTPESQMWKESLAQRKQSKVRLRDTIPISTFVKLFLLALIPLTLSFWAYYGIAALLPVYLTSVGFTLTKASWYVFFTAFGGLMGNWTGSYLNDKIGRRYTGFLMMVIAGISGVSLFELWPLFLTSEIVFLPLFFLFFGLTLNTEIAPLLAELFPTSVRSFGTGAVVQVTRGLSAIPPILAAIVLPMYGYGAMIGIGAIEVFAAAGLMLLFPETRGSILPEAVGAAKGQMPPVSPPTPALVEGNAKNQ